MAAILKLSIQLFLNYDRVLYENSIVSYTKFRVSSFIFVAGIVVTKTHERHVKNRFPAVM